jgi:SAM-dependent methyltransferase
VQFVGAKPQFIDVGSFVPYEGGAWNGYRQFCETFLNPLLIQAHTGVALQPLLRGRLEGVRPADARRILGFARVPRKGVFKNVLVHEYLERNVKSGSQAVGKQLSGSGFGSDLAKSTLDALRKLVRSLKIKDTKTAWTDYRTTCSYTSGEAAEKEAFVARVTGDRPDDLVLDLGCNDARFAQVVAKSVGTVVAVDFDPEVIDAAYRRLRDTNVPNVLALVVDLADPSPALGWANAERPAFTDRVRPDLVFALALVHHLVITANVPLARVLDWLLAFGADLVVEFPHPNDPMVVRLLEQKPAGQHDDFTLDVFLALLAERAEILEQQTLTEGTRTLVLCRPR